MTFLDFFAGIGGFRLGLAQAGHKCVGFCEYDKFAVMSYVIMHTATEEQREYLKMLSFKDRQKEVLKDEYKSGEWYANDIRDVHAGDVPKADMWCFGFPCQDISIAGNQRGFAGERSSLFFRIMRLAGDQKEENKPSILLIENVKNLLSVNGGRDFARLLICLDENGYDAEWQVINSKDYGVPQNRERVYIVGHLRGRGGNKIFPIGEAVEKNYIQQIGQRVASRKNSNSYRVYSANGLSPCLGTMEGGGREPHISLSFCDLTYNGGLVFTDKTRCLLARYNKGITNTYGSGSGIAIIGKIGEHQTDNIYSCYGIVGSLKATDYKNPQKVAMPAGDIYTEMNGEYQSGVLNELSFSGDCKIPFMWYEPYNSYVAIRKLTPRECWRLQGWPDEYFDRARIVNSDTQLYKQAGNGVTVNVVKEVGKKLNGNYCGGKLQYYLRSKRSMEQEGK